MHVGIIMDGNRTWAKKLGLEWIQGHRQGVKALEEALEICPELGIDMLTVYAFSTENFKRSKDQVGGILGIIAQSAVKYKERLIGKNVRTRILGNVLGIPKNVRDPLLELVEATKDCSDTTLQICVNYGGRDEIVRAVNKLISEGVTEVTEDLIIGALDSDNQPDVIIRTGGQQRLSNFLSWQSVYSELFFVDKNWPDFNAQDLRDIMKEYTLRNRKFGV